MKDAPVIKRCSQEHLSLALKAGLAARRLLRLFRSERPDDKRPADAVEAILSWARGRRELGMAEVRRLSLDAHAAARACTSDSARYAARAAGQAVAAWHVPAHALGVAYYAGKINSGNKGR